MTRTAVLMAVSEALTIAPLDGRAERSRFVFTWWTSQYTTSFSPAFPVPSNFLLSRPDFFALC